MKIMENLLLMGIDTRPMVNSALKLDYKTFSISYFKTVDFKVPYRGFRSGKCHILWKV